MAKFLAAVAGLLTLFVAGYVAVNWAPDRSVEQLAPRWAPSPPSTFVEVEGMQVHLRDEGVRDDPHPIVLLHGTSASLHTWDGWVDALKGQRRVIRLDLPGFGLTGPMADGNYAIESYVRFLTAFLDKLAVQHCVLAGNSFGGWVAWETSLALPPGRVEGLILVDAAGYPLDSQDVPVAFRIARIPVLNQLVKYVLSRGMVEASVRNVYGDPTKVTPALVERYYELALREGNREALMQQFSQSLRGQHADRIRRIQVPTLILWGGRDRLIPPSNAARFHADIAGSRLVMFDDLGHVPQEEDPARTVVAAREFLAGGL